MTTLRKSKQPSAAGNLDEQTPGECPPPPRAFQRHVFPLEHLEAPDSTCLTFSRRGDRGLQQGAADPWEAPAPWIEKPDVKECLGRMSCRRLA
ncbi:putative uncharacterized protein encoded by LINC00313 [Pongo abelii]|uniref:putative uncharacterized protein encoded by LINC00313 n=1 Tax=Pongo abelii TaxID=9601 RepID=UPI0023E7F591|nr:putative uncharacterized protein encoded by LINC00313 [Pongo abelii]